MVMVVNREVGWITPGNPITAVLMGSCLIGVANKGGIRLSMSSVPDGLIHFFRLSLQWQLLPLSSWNLITTEYAI